MSENTTTKGTDWKAIRQHAQTRVAMYIGSELTGHHLAILDVLRLVWQAKAFQRPRSVTVDLSPNQCVVRAECGPLIKSIQQILSFGTGETLSQPWREELHRYYERICREDEEKGIDFLRQRHRRGWRYCFSGPTGPRLGEPAYPSVLARSLIWGLRTDDGLWCEAYREAIPTGRPFLIDKVTPVGLFVAADLDPQWFKGLPFTEDDTHGFMDLSHRRYVSHPKYEPRPLWTAGDITANWHPQNDLVSDEMLTMDGLREWL